VSVRLRLDELARFSPEAAAAIPELRAAIGRHLLRVPLAPGQGLILSNTRWLHGRTSYFGDRLMLRILGDPLPAAAIMPGFPSSARLRPGCDAVPAA
jgi:hypothetical protein